MNETMKNGYYSREGVADAVSGQRALARFVETFTFAVDRFNRGRETIRFEIRPTTGAWNTHEVVFWHAGSPECTESGTLKGDLLTISDLCRDYGSRAEFHHLLPRLSRHLFEKEYLSAPRP